MKTKQAEMVTALAAMVDASDLVEVLMCLHIVCLEKAETILDIEQDRVWAKQWERAARAVRDAATHKSVEAVS